MRQFILSSLVLSGFATMPALADDILTTNNGIIRNALCVGAACTDPETFGADRLKLKGTGLRILFEDTSNDGTPDNDWRLVANGLGAGTENMFAIEDATGGTTPFRIMAGARENAFVIDANGRIGINTSLPSSSSGITIIEDTSTSAEIRLVSTFSGVQSYAIRSNRSVGLQFFDATIGRTPLVLRRGAPTGSIDVNENGNVGLGTTTPEVPLHVVRDTGFATDMMRLENNGGVVFRLKDTSPGGQEFTFQSNGGIFRIASPAVPGPEFTMDDFGNVVITGQITTAGSCSAGCDRVFSEEYDLPRMEDHHAAMWAQGHLPNVGPTPEDGPFNLTEKVGGMLNELEHAHIYIGQLHEQLEAQAQQMASQADQLERQAALIGALMARVDAVEAR